MHRRNVIQMLLATAAGGCLLPRRASTAQRAIAPGIQLYTVRSLMEKDAAGTLAAIARIGYREVEFAGLHGATAEAMRGVLDDLGLVSPSSHIGLEELDRGADEVFARSRVLGNRYVVVPWLPEERRRTIDDYADVAAALNRHGRVARDAGLQLGYHNHDFELQRIGGVVPYDVLLDRTDPSLVAMELDLFWLAKGGGDPLTYFARHPGRFAMLHVKDMSADGAMVDVGSGTLDFGRVFADAERAGIRHAFVEHDSPADPLASARASHAALVRLLS
jgi:sugar phosphate isomerase/epimerase